MQTYIGNLEKDTEENQNFRKVLYTGKHCQLVLMTLKVGEDIGMEVHPSVDQFFRFESGQGMVIIDGEEAEVSGGFAVVVPAGSQHNIINTSPTENLKLYTIYSPANHPEGTIHATKAEAMEAEEHEHH
ncbi:MAG: cupin domain-containing protein [Candidatus Pacebacteria bacterium CG_4_10_14_3_um_filter_34_15]|nr:cupin domain-containing protein [Candidatus Pacearchaeota archaeon]NCQ65532.1 cupin domain-containing protein [Candidatus Paceibacterota bacterium]OIO44847.1 MAG: cupin [Candidatus Pacebacteria bacterium CG1_02_43_31]PIQ81278.1 MAG: cupin [Candidatus Pacebacteria bacterium CG11_big_fil_rev_8_21_14_0_20_34_55]PIX81105.1 MAG: cupin domain-containing protein [Candidatus Pacebacteria bacterium CG_4_10_14_3_um_filter_34_15]PJC43856.1 MAG: cupin domain-containing protein [Candidatus Pacebacteria 